MACDLFDLSFAANKVTNIWWETRLTEHNLRALTRKGNISFSAVYLYRKYSNLTARTKREYRKTLT